MSSDPKNKEEGKGSLDTLRRKYFLPKDLENASSEEIWNWWQQKGQQENLLKNAIISSKVSEGHIYVFSPFCVCVNCIIGYVRMCYYQFKIFYCTILYCFITYIETGFSFRSGTQKDIRSDFEEFRPYLAANKAEILQTQSDFCRSVAEADIDLMRSLWLNSPDSMCFKVTRCFSILFHFYTW
jgi:hypothetical protein